MEHIGKVLFDISLSAIICEIGLDWLDPKWLPGFFFHTFSMALYHKWDVKNDFTYVLQFFTLISDSLGSVSSDKQTNTSLYNIDIDAEFSMKG